MRSAADDHQCLSNFIVQDTIRNPPAENKQMKRATVYGISATTFFYLTVGVSGYLAFGNQVCGNILTCFEAPFYLVDLANTCVIIHLLGAYQVRTVLHALRIFCYS